MLETANQFAKDYAHLIQLMMMFAVVGATTISLWASRQAHLDKRVRVDLVCDKASIFEPVSLLPAGGANYRQSHITITATVTNIGLRDTAIPWLGFVLSVPRGKKHAVLQPATNFMRERQLDLTVGDRKTIELRPAKQFADELLGFDLKWFPRMRIRNAKLTLATPTGDVFRAKQGKELRQLVRETARRAAIIYQSAPIDTQGSADTDLSNTNT